MIKEVLRYFIQHPHAADDLEGITRWRLVQHQIRLRVEETRRAIAWLVDRRYLERDVRGGPAIFTLNKDKAEAARALLDSDDAAPLGPQA